MILTLNVPESLAFGESDFQFSLRILINREVKGFGENHNFANRESNGGFFCVLNPDVRINRDPFPELIDALSDPNVGLAAPLVLDPAGHVEDSFRCFPTPLSIVRKLVTRQRRADYRCGTEPVYPDWVAGMFMMWRNDVFRKLGGFDTGYFLYYEDVDICRRMREMNYRAILVPSARVVHAARRTSHRDPRYFCWHATSMARYFLKVFVAWCKARVKY